MRSFPYYFHTIPISLGILMVPGTDTLPETNMFAPENRPLEVWRCLLETTILIVDCESLLKVIYWMVATPIFFMFTPKIGEDEPILTSIFFKGVETTNQLVI